MREAGLLEAETEVWIDPFAPARAPEAVIGTLYDGLYESEGGGCYGRKATLVDKFHDAMREP